MTRTGKDNSPFPLISTASRRGVRRRVVALLRDRIDEPYRSPFLVARRGRSSMQGSTRPDLRSHSSHRSPRDYRDRGQREWAIPSLLRGSRNATAAAHIIDTALRQTGIACLRPLSKSRTLSICLSRVICATLRAHQPDLAWAYANLTSVHDIYDR